MFAWLLKENVLKVSTRQGVLVESCSFMHISRVQSACQPSFILLTCVSREACTIFWVLGSMVSHCSHIAMLSTLYWHRPPLPGLLFTAAGACLVEPDLCPHHNRCRCTHSSSVTAHHISVCIWIYECIKLNAELWIMQEEMEKMSMRHGCYKCRFMCAAISRALEDSYCRHWIWIAWEPLTDSVDPQSM